MGCWGIDAFSSDAGLDAIIFIRKRLPESGKLDLTEIIRDMELSNYVPEIVAGESHSGPMALAEMVVKFCDGDFEGLDYETDWAVKDNKLKDIVSFTADKESLQCLRDYLAKTLAFARFNASQNTDWNGWFEESDWDGWQAHMSKLTERMDELIACPKKSVELVRERNSLSQGEISM